MRDQVSWGFYIGNFTFLVGVAAAAVVLVIPAYVYDWKPIREMVIYGELLAISAIVMCLMFVMVDIGRPDRAWHLFPVIGHLNFPRSILAWDVLVLNVYFLINFTVATHILYRAFHGKHYAKQLVVPLVLLSIPMAVGIHTVTAFLYNGLAARPYWNSSILAPQFLASAFCSGPAILLIVLQLLRRFTRFEIQNQAIWKIAELMAYAMFLNLFLHGAEAFKEYYSHTEHLLYTQILVRRASSRPYAWSAVTMNVSGLRAVHRAGDAAELAHDEYRLHRGLRGLLHREGHGADHPRADARRARRNLRICAINNGAARGRGGVRDRIPGLHVDAEGGGADHARRVQRGGVLAWYFPNHLDKSRQRNQGLTASIHRSLEPRGSGGARHFSRL